MRKEQPPTNARPQFPKIDGVRVIRFWPPRETPIHVCGCPYPVTDVAGFIDQHVERLRCALAGDQRGAGNFSVAGILARLEHVGVLIEVDEPKPKRRKRRKHRGRGRS